MEKQTTEKKVDLSCLAKKWPSGLVARHQVREFTGGIISPGRLANLDAEGRGPKDKIRIGRKIAYPVASFIPWLEEMAEVLD